MGLLVAVLLLAGVSSASALCVPRGAHRMPSSRRAAVTNRERPGSLAKVDDPLYISDGPRAKPIESSDADALAEVANAALNDALAEVSEVVQTLRDRWQWFKGTDRARMAAAHMRSAVEAVGDIYQVVETVIDVAKSPASGASNVSSDAPANPTSPDADGTANASRDVVDVLAGATTTAIRGSALALNIVLRDVVLAPEVGSHVQAATKDLTKAATAFGRVGMLVVTRLHNSEVATEARAKAKARAERKAKKEEPTPPETVSVQWVQKKRSWWGGYTVVDSSSRRRPSRKRRAR